MIIFGTGFWVCYAIDREGLYENVIAIYSTLFGLPTLRIRTL